MGERYMEFRKLIGFGKSSFVISLPKGWLAKNNLVKGSLISVEEEGDQLFLGSKVGDEKKIEVINIDASGLDSSSILHYIQAAYKKGFDEINLKFNEREIDNFKIKEKVSIYSVINKTVDRLVGLEVIKQSNNECTLKDISATSTQEFDNVLRRVFLLIKDLIESTHQGVVDNDKIMLENIQEKHDVITKFIAFCLRLLNKGGSRDSRKTAILFHIIASLDKITDIYKYFARDVVKNGIKLKKETIEILKIANEEFNSYYGLFYKFESKTVVELSRKRRLARGRMEELVKKITPKEVYYASHQIMVLDILLDIIESKIALNLTN